MALALMEQITGRRRTPPDHETLSHITDDELRRAWHSVSPDGELVTTDDGDWHAVIPNSRYRQLIPRSDRTGVVAEQALDTAMETAMAEEARHMRAAIAFYSWTGIPFAGGWWDMP